MILLPLPALNAYGMHFKKILLLITWFATLSLTLQAQQEYPYPVKYVTLNAEQQTFRMAYMDLAPHQANGHTVILFHGKNFNGYYWKDVARYLSDNGYRVIIPDQVGWGKSDKPDIHYSFHLLARNNKMLLDTLHISTVIVLGHSMGGMLATRFALMYPQSVEKLILEDPIGLEDYKTFVPYTTTDELYKAELSATYDSYKKYMQGYFPEWKPEYEELVKQQAQALTDPTFKQIAWANAVTYQMIYEQPVCYEFKNITAKTLLITGGADRTIVGKDKVPTQLLPLHGQYPQMGAATHRLIKNSELVEMDGVGHIPHIQQFENFTKVIGRFLSE